MLWMKLSKIYPVRMLITIMNSNHVLADATEKDCVFFKQIMDSAIAYWKTADEGLEFTVEYK